MGKVLLAEATTTDSWVEADLGSDHADVWLTFDAFFSSTDLATWIGGGSAVWALELSAGSSLAEVFQVSTIFQSSWASGGSPVGDAWQNFEIHHVQGGTCELYIDGTLVDTGTDLDNNPVKTLQLGLFVPAYPSGSVRYDNVKVGTSRGASDLFSDNFESGTLGAWSSTNNDVSVIDDSTAPEEPEANPAVTKISIAFDDGPLVVDPTWTRIDSLDGVTVQEWSINRGRPNELAKTGTGTALIRLVDRGGVLDPTNGGSDLFPNVLPDKQVLIELRDPVLDEYQTRFRGFVEQFNYTLGPREAFWFVEIECVDAFGWLNDHELEPGDGDTPPAGSEGNVFYEDTAGSVDDRINAILADVGWPSGLASIFTGNVKVTETIYAPGTEALAALFDAVDAEFPGVGNLYVDRQGILTFHGRQPRFRPNVAAYGIRKQDVGDPFATALDDTICEISEMSFDLGKGSLYNSVLVYPQDTSVGVAITETEIAGQLVTDPTSITAHGTKGLSFTDLLTIEGLATGNTALEETLLFATYYRDNYKDPLPRINRLVFKTKMPEDWRAGPLWKMLCRSDISDLLTVYTTHPDAGGFDGVGYYIEGIRQTCRPANPLVPEVTLELDVSPQALFTSNPFDSDPDPE